MMPSQYTENKMYLSDQKNYRILNRMLYNAVVSYSYKDTNENLTSVYLTSNILTDHIILVMRLLYMLLAWKSVYPQGVHAFFISTTSISTASLKFGQNLSTTLAPDPVSLSRYTSILLFEFRVFYISVIFHIQSVLIFSSFKY